MSEGRETKYGSSRSGTSQGATTCRSQPHCQIARAASPKAICQSSVESRLIRCGPSCAAPLYEFLAQRMPDAREQLGVLPRLAQRHGITRAREVDPEILLHSPGPGRTPDD